MDLVSSWLSTVSYSHSQSKSTYQTYKRVWNRFSTDVGITAEQILAEYETSQERDFKRKYAQIVRSWIAELSSRNLTNSSIKSMVGTVQSFFKWNDLPLGIIPQAMNGVVFHNRDITKDEIAQLMGISKIREKAIFAVMAQSGLRPYTLKQLKLKNIESFDKVPCKIEVSKEIAKGKFGSYFTFIGPDAIKYLKQYLATRPNLTPESLLFCSQTSETKQMNTKDMSRAFKLPARKLEKSGALKYEVRKGKPSELRLYNLRKFFKKFTHQMGAENVNYLMGHTNKGSNDNYMPKDAEFYRELYAKNAMPFLRIEEATPTESEETIIELRKEIAKRDAEYLNLKKTLHEEYAVKFSELNELIKGYKTLKERMEKLEKDAEEHDERLLKQMEETPEESYEEIPDELK